MHLVGYGFLEKVYERALELELNELDLNAVTQKPIGVYYNGNIAGEYFADLVVENKVIIEVKAVSQISEAHESQTIN